MAKRGRPVKKFQEYLISAPDTHVSHQDYFKSPAVAFLKYCIDAKDAVKNCENYFKTTNGVYTKDGLASLQHIVTALLPAPMGHFETYQRYLFAGVFENSTFLDGFDTEKFFRSLKIELNNHLDRNFASILQKMKKK